MEIDFKYHLKNANYPSKVIATFWWTGKTIKCSNKEILKDIEGEIISGKMWHDGVEFFKVLPDRFRSWYAYLEKVPDDKKDKDEDEDK